MMPSRDLATNLAAVGLELESLHKEKQLSGGYGEIRLGMFTPSSSEKFPCLKGQAGEVRKLGGPLLDVWERKMTPSNKQHRLARIALQSSVELERILDDHEGAYRLTGDTAVKFRDLCFRYAACVSSLATHDHAKGIFLFHSTVKMHYLVH